MSIFPFPAALPEFAPTFNNIGVINITSVVNNSSVTIGDSSSDDTLSLRKVNEGFGAVWGNANLIPASVNLVSDNDVCDQNSTPVQNDLNIGPSF